MNSRKYEIADRCADDINPDLLRYSFNEKITSAAAAEITKNINLDFLCYYYSLMLAKAGTRDGFDGFREDIVPRLKGLYRLSIVRRAARAKQTDELLKKLKESGTDFICGYFLSVSLYYAANDIMADSNVFDIVVRSADYEKAKSILSKASDLLEISIKKNDNGYVREHCISINRNGENYSVLNPTSLIMLYAPGTFVSLSQEIYVNELFDRLKWLYYYQIIMSHKDGIDYRQLLRTGNMRTYCTIRYILEYAEQYYGEAPRPGDKRILHNAFYSRFLEKTNRRQDR